MPELIELISRLEDAGRKIDLRESQDDLVEIVVSTVDDLFHADICALFFLDGDRSQGRFAKKNDPNRFFNEVIRSDRGIIGWVLANKEPLWVPDVNSNQSYYKQFDETLSEMAVPLVFNGELQGVIDLQSFKSNGFTILDFTLLKLLGQRVSSVIAFDRERHARREEVSKLSSMLDRLDLIHRVGMALIEISNIEDSIQKVVDMVATTLKYSQTAVLLLDPDLEELDLVSSFGYGEVKGLRIPLSQGATGYAASQRESVNIADVTTDPRYVKGINRGRSELAVPILHGDEVIGVIDVESPELAAFGPQDVQTLEVVASYAAAAIHNARIRAKLYEG